MNDHNPRIEGYHAHVYYDAATRPAAERLAESVGGKFTVEIGGFFDEPVGPHPVANLAIVFKSAEFATVVPWLMLNRGGLSVLVHPLTDDSVRDHDTDGAWLGTPVPLRLHAMTRDYTPDLLPPA
jgi:aromatic ring-cleaving dioxygenase